LRIPSVSCQRLGGGTEKSDGVAVVNISAPQALGHPTPDRTLKPPYGDADSPCLSNHYSGARPAQGRLEHLPSRRGSTTPPPGLSSDYSGGRAHCVLYFLGAALAVFLVLGAQRGEIGVEIFNATAMSRTCDQRHRGGLTWPPTIASTRISGKAGHRQTAEVPAARPVLERPAARRELRGGILPQTGLRKRRGQPRCHDAWGPRGLPGPAVDPRATLAAVGPENLPTTTTEGGRQ
jgi:hypothetical protein